jgi:hypothetical protein
VLKVCTTRTVLKRVPLPDTRSLVNVNRNDLIAGGTCTCTRLTATRNPIKITTTTRSTSITLFQPTLNKNALLHHFLNCTFRICMMNKYPTGFIPFFPEFYSVIDEHPPWSTLSILIVTMTRNHIHHIITISFHPTPTALSCAFFYQHDPHD